MLAPGKSLESETLLSVTVLSISAQCGMLCQVAWVPAQLAFVPFRFTNYMTTTILATVALLHPDVLAYKRVMVGETL